MRFGTIGGRLALVREDPTGSALALDVETASGGRFPAEVNAALGTWPALREWSGTADWAQARPVTDAELGPPVPSPRQVFAVGFNYRPHAHEAQAQIPDRPMIFTKFASCITGPVTTVSLPPGRVDWEIEVVAVVGTGGRSIAPEDAWNALAGLTVGQDLSERELQLSGAPAQFSLGKSHAGFGPTGPVVVTPDEFADPDDIGFESFLDGERLQHGRTSEMIFPVTDLVARLSAVCELLPGDLIFTGTPSGVGNRRVPQRFLRPGETLVSRVEGIGELRQQFVS